MAFFSSSMPTDHKNQARFVAPPLNSLGISSFKAEPNCSVAEFQNVLNHLNPNQQPPKVQKLDLSLEHKLRQMNGNGYYAGQASNGFSPSIMKTESDSNESNHSDGRINNLSNFSFLTSHSSAADQRNAGTLNNSGCFSLNILEGLSVPGQTSLTNLHVNKLSYLTTNGLIASNLISHNMINAKMPESSGKRTASGRKPTNSKEVELSPNEELKRKQRRERNKQAAAKCRKKRVEQTKTLEEETIKLQQQKDYLSNEIACLKRESDKLFSILNEHDCKFNLKVN